MIFLPRVKKKNGSKRGALDQEKYFRGRQGGGMCAWRKAGAEAC